FPTLFGKPKEIMQRYLALLTVITINSTVYILRACFERSVKNTWWGSDRAIWIFMTVVTLVGLVWAWRRYKTQAVTPETLMPKKGEVIVFQLLSIVCLAVAAYLLGWGVLFEEGREIVMLCGVVWGGMLGIFYLRHALSRIPSEPKPEPSPEGVLTPEQIEQQK